MGKGIGSNEISRSSSSGSNSKGRRRSSSSRGKKNQSEEANPDPRAPTSGSQSFLDGNFNGFWQSNEDIPDRRRVIYSICKVMRPNASKFSQRLPFMAKRLEEHLYRSAQTKEEYLDPSTLKKRLQSGLQGGGDTLNQNRKVVKQQQQRLLLLRHASKCKAGNSCKVEFCGQMVLLWKHMKKSCLTI